MPRRYRFLDVFVLMALKRWAVERDDLGKFHDRPARPLGCDAVVFIAKAGRILPMAFQAGRLPATRMASHPASQTSCGACVATSHSGWVCWGPNVISCIVKTPISRQTRCQTGGELRRKSQAPRTRML